MDNPRCCASDRHHLDAAEIDMTCNIYPLFQADVVVKLVFPPSLFVR